MCTYKKCYQKSVTGINISVMVLMTSMHSVSLKMVLKLWCSTLFRVLPSTFVNLAFGGHICIHQRKGMSQNHPVEEEDVVKVYFIRTQAQ